MAMIYLNVPWPAMVYLNVPWQDALKPGIRNNGKGE